MNKDETSKQVLAKHDTDILRILLIEDNPADVDLLRERLIRLPDNDIQLTHVACLKDALIYIHNYSYDVLLTDLGLPDSSGQETVQQLVAAAPTVALVILTDTQDDDLALACITAGAQDYLCKAELNTIGLRRVLGFAISRQREVYIRELQASLEQFRRLSSAASGSTQITRQLAGLHSLQERDSVGFLALCQEYRLLFEPYMQQLVVKAPKPVSAMKKLIDKIGNKGGGPKDLVDVHMLALEAVISHHPDNKANAYAIDGRLLCLEMMGLLVDYYRLGHRRLSHEPTSHIAAPMSLTGRSQ